ncbi:MAG: four helix bundle protein [Candidatus Pacebacteria bacterium]|nr:four helix bundle protein [Candidatus Paceibacterota bacterium]MDD2935444.1 four helix bundle protein [Candidatus Paceibacterota bacterium]
MQNEKEKFKNEFKKRLYIWTLRLIKFIDKLNKDSVCNVMGKQLLRSGTSILSNYVEAWSASSKKDYINFFTYSLKSSNESKVWLSLLKDINKGDRKELGWLLGELQEISNIIASGIITMKGKR